MYSRLSIVAFIFCISLNAGVGRLVMLEKKSISKAAQHVYLLSVDDQRQELDSHVMQEMAYGTLQVAEELFYWFDRVDSKGGKKFLLDSRYPYDSSYAQSFAPLHFCQCLVEAKAECAQDNEEIIKEQLRQKDVTKLLQALGKHAEDRSDVYYISKTIAELEANLSSLKGYGSVYESALHGVYNNCSVYARDRGIQFQDFLEKIDARLNDFIRVLEKDAKLLKNKKQKINVQNHINFIESQSKHRFNALSHTLKEFDDVLKEGGFPVLTVQELMLRITLSYLRSGVLKEMFGESHTLFAQISYPNQMAVYYALEYILAPTCERAVFCASEAEVIGQIQEMLIGEGYTVIYDSRSMFGQDGNPTIEKQNSAFLTNELIAKFFYRSFEPGSQKQEL